MKLIQIIELKLKVRYHVICSLINTIHTKHLNILS